MEQKQTPFRVLTLDGGGMRGLYTAIVLKTLMQRFNVDYTNQYDLGKSFNLICGTSTGAILACGLAIGIPIEKIIDLYVKNGSLIFPEPIPKGIIASNRWLLKYRNKPAADVQSLKKALKKCFGDNTINDVYQARNISLCIPTVDANNYKPWVFKTGHNPEKFRDNKYKITDVCLASSSAPIYFPLAKITDPNNNKNNQFFVDGGLWANNPILVGLTEALQINKDNKVPIEIISIGTCTKPLGDPAKLADYSWGIKKWIIGNTIMEMSLSAQAYGHNYIAEFIADSCRNMGKDVRVIRLEETHKSPEQISAIGLDKADQLAIDTLINLATQDVNNIHSKLLKKTEYDPVKDIFQNLIKI